MGVNTNSATFKDASGNFRVDIVVRNTRNIRGTITLMKMTHHILVHLEVLNLKTLQTNRVTFDLQVTGSAEGVAVETQRE